MIDKTFGGYKILPLEYIKPYKEQGKKTLSACVLIHLYYLDTVDYYFNYIKNIGDSISIIFTYDNDELKGRIESNIKKYDIKNCKLIKKENRGRDISALLVAAREEIKKYDLVCFVHDKKASDSVYIDDTKEWIELSWTNLLGSENYIENILNLFENDTTIGILFPPQSSSRNIKYDLCYNWDKDLDNAKNLAKNLGLSVIPEDDMDYGSPGTMFWARTSAIRKLLDYGWQYESFDPEPLAKDGTLSHAIEKTIRFASMDAGYKEYIVLSDRSAEKYLAQVQSDAREEYKILNDKLSIHYHDIEYYESWADRLLSFVADFSEIYIYGARIYGIQCLKILRDAGYSVTNFVVSSKEGNPDRVYGIPVISFSELYMNERSCLVIAMDHSYYPDIQSELMNKNIGVRLEENINVLFYQIYE